MVRQPRGRSIERRIDPDRLAAFRQGGGRRCPGKITLRHKKIGLQPRQFEAHISLAMQIMRD